MTQVTTGVTVLKGSISLLQHVLTALVCGLVSALNIASGTGAVWGEERATVQLQTALRQQFG